MKRALLYYQFFKAPKDVGGVTGIRGFLIGNIIAKYLDTTIVSGSKETYEISENFSVFGTDSFDRASYNKKSFFQKIISFFSYKIKGFSFALKEKNVDLIYCSSAPLTLGIVGVLVKKIKKAKFVFEVRDVWPDVPISLGILKNKLLIYFLKKMEYWIYYNSDSVVVASKGMKDNLLNKGIPEDKVFVITNICDNESFDKITEEQMENIRTEYNLQDKFICIHPGTMGFVNGLNYVLDAAQFITDKDVVFLLVGDGKEKVQLMERAKEEKINNVIFMDPLSKDKVNLLIKASDIGIMTTIENKALEDNSANKFFDFLSARLPIIVNYGGWQKEVIEENKCGISVSGNKAKELADMVIKFKDMSYDEKQMYKDNSRKLANSYSLEAVEKEIKKIFDKIGVK